MCHPFSLIEKLILISYIKYILLHLYRTYYIHFEHEKTSSHTKACLMAYLNVAIYIHADIINYISNN